MIVADTVKPDQYIYIKLGVYCIVSLFVIVTYHLMKYTKNYYYKIPLAPLSTLAVH